MNWFYHLKNFPMGMFIGLLFGILIHFIFTSEISDQLMRYGTFLLAMLATLLASGIALAGALNSADTQRQLDEDNRMRRLNSAKASLPYSLSDAINCALAGLTESALRFHGHGNVNPNLYEEIQPKKASIDNIISVIRNADPNEGKVLSLMLSNFQVYVARINSLPVAAPPSGRRHENMEAIAYWAYLYLLTGHCFEFARGQDGIENRITKTGIVKRMREALGDGFLNPYTGENPDIEMYAGVYYRAHNRKLIE